jgi:Mn-dependent DtxR family transcriptional regulator
MNANRRALLKAIIDKPGRGLSEIAEEIGVSRQSVSQMAGRMASRKLLDKTGRGAYTATAEGKAIVYPEALP